MKNKDQLLYQIILIFDLFLFTCTGHFYKLYYTVVLPDALKQIFEPELQKEILSEASVVSATEGQVILDIGQTVRIVPVILRGILKISRVDQEGKELLLYYVNPNESCAMTFTCCMQQFPSEIKATAETDIEYIAVPIVLMNNWLNAYPGWKAFVMKTIRSRFNELLQTIDQLAFHRLDERLINYLKAKSEKTGSSLLNLSHEQIANELASSREVISRLLKKMENDQKLLLYRNQIKIIKEL